MATTPVMNDTKWNELRLAMYSLGNRVPRWRTLNLENGHLCPWDREWFYHFREGGYRAIEWVEIEVTSDEQRTEVLKVLREIHVPGEASDRGFTVYGYRRSDRPVDYI